jgi:hypothetical protein
MILLDVIIGPRDGPTMFFQRVSASFVSAAATNPGFPVSFVSRAHFAV